MDSKLSPWENYWRSTCFPHLMLYWGYPKGLLDSLIVTIQEEYEGSISDWLEKNRGHSDIINNAYSYMTTSSEEASKIEVVLDKSLKFYLKKIAENSFKEYLNSVIEIEI